MLTDRTEIARDLVLKIAGHQPVGQGSVKRAIGSVAEATGLSERRIRSIFHREVQKVSDDEIATLRRCAEETQTTHTDTAGAARAEIGQCAIEILADIMVAEKNLAIFLARENGNARLGKSQEIDVARELLGRVIDLLIPAQGSKVNNGVA